MVRLNKRTRSEVAATLEECLRFLSNGKSPKAISMNLLVLSEWELDSEHGVELATDLCTRLGIDIPANENPLIEETGPEKKRRERTFGEVVDYLVDLQNN
jgi:acyl carrier protein